MAAPVTREAFVEMLHDYVRDALRQRLHDKHSSHFTLCAGKRNFSPHCPALTVPARARRLLTSFDRLSAQPAHEVKARGGPTQVP